MRLVERGRLAYVLVLVGYERRAPVLRRVLWEGCLERGSSVQEVGEGTKGNRLAERSEEAGREGEDGEGGEGTMQECEGVLDKDVRMVM